MVESSCFGDRQREATALECGPQACKPGGMRLLLSALCAGVLGGAIIAGAPFAAGDVQRARKANAWVKPVPATSRSRGPVAAMFGASAIYARAATGVVNVAAHSQVTIRGLVMSASRGGVDRIVGPYGTGGAEVWLVLPNTPERSVVVFGHGWKLTPPFPGHPWVDQFRPWLDHLAAGRSAVIFPNYQLGSGDAPTRVAYRTLPPQSEPDTSASDDPRCHSSPSATRLERASPSATARTRAHGGCRSRARCRRRFRRT